MPLQLILDVAVLLLVASIPIILSYRSRRGRDTSLRRWTVPATLEGLSAVLVCIAAILITTDSSHDRALSFALPGLLLGWLAIGCTAVATLAGSIDNSSH